MRRSPRAPVKESSLFGLMILLLGMAPPAAAQEPPHDYDALLPHAPEVPTLAQLERLGMVWLEDAPPAGARTEGTWNWNLEWVASGTQSHGHPAAPGIQRHGFTAEPVTLWPGGMIVQEVWLDPHDPPRGIALKFRLAEGGEVGVYWEGEEEVFVPQSNEELWYYGSLPKLGAWAKLEILVEDLGLGGRSVSGLNFLTHGGRALWDRTIIIKEAPAPQEPAVENPLAHSNFPKR